MAICKKEIFDHDDYDMPEPDRYINIGLCAGRHDIPGVNQYIFQEIKNPSYLPEIRRLAIRGISDAIGEFYTTCNLYVTGLTVALVEVLKLWPVMKPKCKLVLWHYNSVTKEYFRQDTEDYK